MSLDFRINLVENIRSTLTAVNAPISALQQSVVQLEGNLNTLPHSIADLRGELSLLREKRDFASKASDVEQYNRQISQTEQQLHKLENLPPKSFLGNLKALGEQMGLTFGVAAISLAAVKIKSFIGSSIAAFDEQEKAMAQVRASISSTAGVAGRSLEELSKQATELQRTTLFGDDATMRAQSILLTFTNVRTAIFDQAIPAIADLSTKMGVDLSSATQMVGKALNDPIQGISALKRAGVQMSDQQEDSIKKLVKMGKMQEAQQMIVNELQTQFGGAAAAAAEAGKGPIEQLSNMWGDFQEMVGGSVLSLVNLVIPALKGVVGFLSDNYEVITSLAIALTAGTIAWGLFSAGAWIAAGGIATACSAIKIAITSIPIVGWIAGAITLLVGLAVYFYKTSDTFRAVLDGVWSALKGFGGFVMELFGGIGKLIKGVFTLDASSITSGIDQIKRAGADLGAAYTHGYNESMARSAADKQDKESKQASGTTGFAPSIGGKIDSVASGGSSASQGTARNITIHIGKVVESFNVHTTQMQGDLSQVREMVAAALIDAVNDANMAI